MGRRRSASRAYKSELVLIVKMPFSIDERKALLALKGIGPTVISRLEEMGYDSLAQLASANTQHIVSQAAAITGSTCWKNSPQARAAIDSIIQLANNN